MPLDEEAEDANNDVVIDTPRTLARAQLTASRERTTPAPRPASSPTPTLLPAILSRLAGGGLEERACVVEVLDTGSRLWRRYKVLAQQARPPTVLTFT